MEKKQTAVEWLEDKLSPDMKTMQGNIIQDLLEQAKEMEKDQIIKAYADGANHRLKNTITSQYYKENYGKETDSLS